MLNYLPPSRGPLFQLLASEAFSESPDGVALTTTLFQVIWSHPQGDLEAPNVLDYLPPSRGSHQNFIVGHLVTPTHRSGGSKCAELSAAL